MSVEITTAQHQQYTSDLQLLLQQRGSRIRPNCMVKNFTGKAAVAVEQIGSVTAQQRTSRHADTPLISTPHDKRWLHPTDFELADLIDTQDRLRMLINPDGGYAQNHAYAMGRQLDSQFIDAALGTSYTGENGTTQTAFDTTNQQIAASSAGLTMAKLKTAHEILMSNNVDIDNDPLFLIVTGTQHKDLLDETQVVSKDYNERPVIESGKIKSILGFNVIHTEELGVDGSSNRRVIAYAKSGMCMGLWNDVSTRISERADKSYATQVYACMTSGATRIEEGKVVEILCSES